MSNDRIPEELKKHTLAKILASRAFQRSEQLRRLFSSLAQASLVRKDAPTEYEVGVSALKRNADFDPQTDSIVRREMCRLREKLLHYYAEEGRFDPVRLDCSNGYRVEFRRVDNTSLGNRGGMPCVLLLPVRAGKQLNEWASQIFDELFFALASSGCVELVAQTTSLRYAGLTGDVRAFAAETGADLVLEGTARRAKPAAKIATLWLVDGKSGCIRSQFRLPDGAPNVAVQMAMAWLSEMPELKRRSPIADSVDATNSDSTFGAPCQIERKEQGQP